MSNSFIKISLFWFLLLTKICNGQAIDENSTFYASNNYTSEIKKAGELVKELMKGKNIPGLSICVATKNKIVWAEGFGYSDLENKLPIRLNSKFRIGSISKTLTGLALSKLIENNQMNMSAKLTNYVDYFTEKKYPVTIYQLASHTAGIRDYNYRNGEYTSTKKYGSVKESISIFKDDTLLFAPGTKYNYSTYGYVLLSAAIESATKQDFLKYMHDSVLTIMNLKNTVPDYNDSIIPNRVDFYDETNGKIVNGFHVDNSNKWAGGGYLSTPYDLALMSQNLFNYQFLKKASVEKLWTADTLNNGQKVNYGIGWKLDSDALQRKYVYHGGSSIGGRSFLLVYPKEELIIAIICNLSTNFDQKFVLQVADLFIKKTNDH